MNTIPFSLEMRALAHVMIHNLYPVTNLTTLSTGRTKFLYDLFTHQEIDICGKIFHLLKKSIEKQHSRTVMPFPPTNYGLNCEDKAQIPEWPHCCSEGLSHWCKHSHQNAAHIKGSKTSMHMIPQDRVADEGEDMEEEIDRFTSATKPSAQPSSSTLARGPDRLDRLLDRIEQMYTMLDSYMRHTWFRLRVRPVQALWPFRSKRGRNFEGELSQC